MRLIEFLLNFLGMSDVYFMSSIYVLIVPNRDTIVSVFEIHI